VKESDWQLEDRDRRVSDVMVVLFMTAKGDENEFKVPRRTIGFEFVIHQNANHRNEKTLIFEASMTMMSSSFSPSTGSE